MQAGHPPPLVIRGNGQMEFLGQGGLPIGLITDATHSFFQIVLNSGDRILLYSDGFKKCETQSGVMLEEEGLMSLVSTCDFNVSGQAFLEDLLQKLKVCMGPRERFDYDISMTLFEFNGL